LSTGTAPEKLVFHKKNGILPRGASLAGYACMSLKDGGSFG